MCHLQYVMSLLCICKHQQSKGRTASRTHREHLDCKHFKTHSHTPSRLQQKLCWHDSKLSLSHAHKNTAHIHTWWSLTHTLHSRSIDYIVVPFRPPNPNWEHFAPPPLCTYKSSWHPSLDCNPSCPPSQRKPDPINILGTFWRRVLRQQLRERSQSVRVFSWDQRSSK